MDDLSALRHELADLRREVAVLKRTRWITPSSLAVALVSLVALGVAAPRGQGTVPTQDHTPSQIAQDLSCKSLSIVDATGKTMLKLQTDPKGGGGAISVDGVNGNTLLTLKTDVDGGVLEVDGADGKPRMYAGVANNAGYTDWYDSLGARRASLFIGDQGAEFHLVDQLGQIDTILQQTSAGGGIQLNGHDGSVRLHEGVSNGGGFLDLYDNLGSVRGSLYLDPQNTSILALNGADKVQRLMAVGYAKGGEVISYGQDGKPTDVFPPKK